MKIAVIGSGIAGLSATWYLGQHHDVTLYEKGHKLGMDAQTAEVDCSGTRVQINVPMRVFFPEYYPTLTALYQALGIEYAPIQYSGSFSEFGGDPYFRYRNYWIGKRSVSFLSGRSLFSARAIRLGAEILRFMRDRNARVKGESLDRMSLEEYVAQKGYSKAFSEDFLYPTFAGICTCSYDSIRSYPASMICEYLDSGLMGSRVNRLVKGTQDAASRMASAARQIHFGADLRALEVGRDEIRISNGDQPVCTYDHVVIATQANQALRLLPQGCERERQVLGAFRYEKSRVIVHRDQRMIPRSRSEWAPVNFMMSAEQDKPMASIWMNRIHPELRDEPDVFETWNPYVEVPEDQTLLVADFERPVVTQASLRGVDALGGLHEEPDRRIWFAGSYAQRGIPLLESAAASSKAIAERLNAPAQSSSQGNAPRKAKTRDAVSCA